MTIVELRRKDKTPLFCSLESISMWTSAVGDEEEEKGYCNVWIGGKVWTLGMTVAEVDDIIRTANRPGGSHAT